MFERFFTLEPILWGQSMLKLYPLDLILGAVFVSAFFLFLKNGKQFFHFRKCDYWLISFFILVTILFLVTVGNSADISLSVAFSTWKQYVFYGLMIFFLGGMIRSKEDVISLLKLFFMGLAFASLFLFVGILRGEGLWTEFTPLSTAGTRFLAFPHAFYYSIGLAILILSLPVWFKKGNPERTFSLSLFSIVLTAGIIGSLMRHLWLGFSGMLFVALFSSPFTFGRTFLRYLRSFILPASFLFAFFMLFVLVMPTNDTSLSATRGLSVVGERVTSIGNEYDESFAWRGKVWESTLARFKTSPLFGIGFGASVPVELGDYRQYVEVRNMHNSWLALLVQTGIVGAFLFLGYLASLVISFWRLPGDSFLNKSRFVLSGVLIFECLVFFSQPYLETNLLSIFFWSTLGIIRAVIEIEKRTVK